MKKNICCVLLCTICLFANAQQVEDTIQVCADSLRAEMTLPVIPKEMTRLELDSILIHISHLLDKAADKNEMNKQQERYKMYQTENLYNLLKLDTQTGMLEQVQWALSDGYEGTFSIISIDLSWDNSCFELYPTKNMYQFILLDRTWGRVWHVQWGTESSKRWYQRIY